MQVWRLGVLQTWQLHRLEVKKIPVLGPDSTSQPHLLFSPLPAHSHIQRGSSLRLFPPVWVVFKRKILCNLMKRRVIGYRCLKMLGMTSCVDVELYWDQAVGHRSEVTGWPAIHKPMYKPSIHLFTQISLLFSVFTMSLPTITLKYIMVWLNLQYKSQSTQTDYTNMYNIVISYCFTLITLGAMC